MANMHNYTDNNNNNGNSSLLKTYNYISYYVKLSS